jgi:probable HAF family extracellular repeat protein
MKTLAFEKRGRTARYVLRFLLRAFLCVSFVSLTLSASPWVAGGRPEPRRSRVPTYRVTELGTPDIYTEATAINNETKIVGAIQSATIAPYFHAFLWTEAEGIRDLGTLGSPHSSARDINNFGVVVGESQLFAGEGPAFRWTEDGGMVDLGYWQPEAINDKGQIAGYSWTLPGYSDSHAVLWTEEADLRDLGTLGVETSSDARDINNLGTVVGDSRLDNEDVHAFVWRERTGMRDLGTLGGTMSAAYAVNRRGQIVGQSTTETGEWHAFLWSRRTGMVDLGTLGGANSRAMGINDHGVIVGSSDTADGRHHAVVWFPHLRRMVDLGLEFPDEHSWAMDINDAGEICGNHWNLGGGGDVPHAVLWRPE